MTRRAVRDWADIGWRIARGFEGGCVGMGDVLPGDVRGCQWVPGNDKIVVDGRGICEEEWRMGNEFEL